MRSPQKQRILISLVLLLLTSALCAAPPDYYGKPVESIALIPARQPIPLDTLLETIDVEPGSTVTADLVAAIIQRLFRTGRFNQIRVSGELLDSGGVELRIETEHKWFVGNVNVLGVDAPPNPGELKNATKLEMGREFTQRDEDAAVTSLENILQRNGYYGVEILPVHDYNDSTQQVNVAFYVQTPPRAIYGAPTFEGNLEFNPEKLVGKSNWEKWWGLLGWKDVTESRTQSGVSNIRRFYQRNDYLMARVRLLDLNFDPASNRVHPRVEVDPGSEVNIDVQGAKLSSGRKRQLIPVYEEQSVDRDLLVEGARNIEEYFETKGYFNADITFDLKDAEEGEEAVVYQVDTGERKKLVNIDLEGNTFFSREDILERLYVLPASLQFRRGRLSEGYLRQDMDTIRNLYLTNGFRDVNVDYEVVDPFGNKEGEVGLVIRIEEGAQVFVRELRLQGAETDEQEDIRQFLTMLESQPFSFVNATADRDNILSYYYNLGYPNTNFEFRVLDTGNENLVDVVYDVDRGQQRFVREVLVSGLQSTDPELVYKRIELFQGQPLSQSALVESQRRLYDLGIFANVDFAIQNPEGMEDSKYVLFQLEESKRYSSTVGFGAELGRIGGGSDFQSAAGATNFSPRVQFEITRLNMFGIAHSLSFRSRVSNIQQRALINYLAPQFRNRDNLNLAFTAVGDQSRDVRTYTSRRFEGSVQLGQRWSLARNILYRLAWRQTSIDVGTANVNVDLIPVLATPAKVGILSATYIEDKRDDPTDSTRGVYSSLDVGIASRAFLSQSDFGRFLGRNSSYHRLTNKLVLARTTTFGLLEPITSRFRERTGVNIPIPERYFAGGAASHRGFPENQAGPRDLITGFPIGGDAVLTNGVELRFPLIGNSLGGVIFHDSGNVYTDLRKLSFRVKQPNLENFDYMVHAVGIGFRYQTPIGPFRVDLAYTLNPPNFLGFQGTREELITLPPDQLALRRVQQSVGNFQFHFSLGQSF